MKKYDVFQHAAKSQGFEDAIQALRHQQSEHTEALVAEARKILEAGGIEQKISEHAEARWRVWVSLPQSGDDARVTFHATFMYGYEGEGEWTFNYDELARADEIAYWIDEREGSKRRAKERERAQRDFDQAAERLKGLD